MSTINGQLSPRQYRAVESLLNSRSVQHAADTCGMGYKTLLRWMQDPQFKAALMVAEGESLDGAVRRLAGLGNTAITILADVMSNGESELLRLRAAQSVLDNLLKLRELRSVEERISRLEVLVHGE